MFLILGALRNFSIGMFALRNLAWRGKATLGHDPEGKVLGILGMGGIGKNLKKKAEAFGMKIQYHNRRELSEELSGGAKYVSFDELLATSDVISLNLPLNVGIPFKNLPLLSNKYSYSPGTHTTHHFHSGVCKDEGRRGHRQHRPRRRHR